LQQQLQAAGSSEEYAAAALAAAAAAAAARVAQDGSMQQQPLFAEQHVAGGQCMSAALHEDADVAWQQLAAAARAQQAAAGGAEGLAGNAGSASNLLALLRDGQMAAAHAAADPGAALCNYVAAVAELREGAA
jgi:hypothetical protein